MLLDEQVILSGKWFHSFSPRVDWPSNLSIALNSIERAPVQRQVPVLPVPRRCRRARRRSGRPQADARRREGRPAKEGRSYCHTHSIGARCRPESDPAKTVSTLFIAATLWRQVGPLNKVTANLGSINADCESFHFKIIPGLTIGRRTIWRSSTRSSSTSGRCPTCRRR